MSIFNISARSALERMMLRRGVLFICVLLLNLGFLYSQSDTTANWINYSQNYYKLLVTERGIYRVKYEDLTGAGLNPNAGLFSKMQLWYRGQQQYIYVFDQNGNDNWDSADYFEFYGMFNDGELDTELYRYSDSATAASKYQPSTRYSLFTDTSAYFLTWGSTNGIRFQDFNDSASITETTCWSEGYVGYTHGDPWATSKSGYYKGIGSGNNANVEASQGVQNTDYTYGEGYMRDLVSNGEILSVDVNTPDAATMTGDVEVKVSPYSWEKHYVRVSINGGIPGEKIDTFSQSNPPEYWIFPFPNTSITSPITTVTVESVNNGDAANNNVVAYISIKYKRDLNLNSDSEFYFKTDPMSSNRTFQFSKHPGGLSYVYDLQNHDRVTLSGSDAVLRGYSGSNQRECFFVTEDSIRTPMIDTTTVTLFTNISNISNTDSVDYIIVTHRSLDSGAADYKDYRENYMNPVDSVKYKVKIIYADQIMNEFGYGSIGDLAMKRFGKKLTQWTPMPKYLLLLGEAAEIYRYGNHLVLVPSFGVPVSDIDIVSRIDWKESSANDFAPMIAVSRISVRGNSEINDYLNKVKQYESGIGDNKLGSPWMKELLHLGGGKTKYEIEGITQTLEDYEKIAEDCPFGGNVTSFYKSTTNPIQTNIENAIRDRINQGVIVITFFGHSAPNTWDVALDDPELWQNFNKYPYVFSLGCYNGNFGIDNKGERFIKTPNKGAIGYLAHSGTGWLGTLDLYGTDFYNALYKGDTTDTVRIGDVLIQTIKDFSKRSFSQSYINHSRQMSPQGDPAIRLNFATKPDFEIQPTDITFEPDDFTALSDSFLVKVVVSNWGRVPLPCDTPVTYSLTLNRQFPNGSGARVGLMQGLNPVKYKDTLTFMVKSKNLATAGLNKFCAFADTFMYPHSSPPGAYDEYSETNNEACVIKEIKANAAAILFPIKYSIVNQSMVSNDTIKLVAGVYNIFSKDKKFYFEMDTDYNKLFTNADYKSPEITGDYYSAEWKLRLDFSLVPDSTVFYWRVRIEEQQGWTESSFIYIKNSPEGWAQYQMPQFYYDAGKYVGIDKTQNIWTFVPTVTSLTASTRGDQKGPVFVGYKINNDIKIDETITSGCGIGTRVAVIDPLKPTYPWVNNIVPPINPGCYQYLVDTNYTGRTFFFNTSYQSERDRLRDFLLNTVPDDFYVLVYSTFDTTASIWNQDPSPNIYDAFSLIGANPVTAEQNVNYDGYPFILFGKKGAAVGTASEVYYAPASLVPPRQQVISFTGSIISSWYQGTITSELIGPASKWKSAFWEYESFEASDKFSIDIIGVRPDGTEQELFQQIPSVPNAMNQMDFLGREEIDENEFPYIKLRANVEDGVILTPPQLKHWIVIYDGVPEATLDPGPDSTYYFVKDTIFQGESIKARFSVRNISDLPMDSMLVHFYINNPEVDNTLVKAERLGSLDSLNAFVTANITLPTYPDDIVKGGINYLKIEANPNWDQPEQYHFNNVVEFPFYVIADKTNPLMDVTFDGVHIISGDIVSPHAELKITLHDNNKLFPIIDTTKKGQPPFQYVILVRESDGKSDSLQGHTVNGHYISNASGTATYVFGGYGIEFIPGSLPKNEARLVIKPDGLPDGKYTLTVRGLDYFSNQSSGTDYSIDFEVKNKSTITHILNYPNPFSTATRFVFTLTGSKVPDIFRIQIFTLTGKLVKEINLSEFGNIKIGQNISEYVWDGRDEYGDLLANGVYFYRVISKIEGVEIEITDESQNEKISNMFTKGFGKLYIMR